MVPCGPSTAPRRRATRRAGRGIHAALLPVTLLADCCAAKTRRLHELSIEVLTSYELAGIANISEGNDIGLDRTPVSA